MDLRSILNTTSTPSSAAVPSDQSRWPRPVGLRADLPPGPAHDSHHAGPTGEPVSRATHPVPAAVSQLSSPASSASRRCSMPVILSDPAGLGRAATSISGPSHRSAAVSSYSPGSTGRSVSLTMPAVGLSQRPVIPSGSESPSEHFYQSHGNSQNHGQPNGRYPVERTESPVPVDSATQSYGRAAESEFGYGPSTVTGSAHSPSPSQAQSLPYSRTHSRAPSFAPGRPSSPRHESHSPSRPDRPSDWMSQARTESVSPGPRPSIKPGVHNRKRNHSISTVSNQSSPVSKRHRQIVKPERVTPPAEMTVPAWAIRADWDSLGSGPVAHKEPGRPETPPLDPTQPLGRAGGLNAYSGLHRAVADFLFDGVVNAPAFSGLKVDIEVEAKFGVIECIQPDGSRGRLALPITTEAVVVLDSGMTFSSSVSEEQYHHVAEYFAQTRPRDRPVRTVTTDTFFTLPAQAVGLLPEIVQHKHGLRVRQSRQADAVDATIVKVRMLDLHIHYPGQPLDVRISLNLEIQCDGALGRAVAPAFQGRPTHERRKNRLSFDTGDIRADLTVIGPGGRSSASDHELELELNVAEVRSHGARLIEGKPNRFDHIVQTFLSTIFSLSHTNPDMAL